MRNSTMLFCACVGVCGMYCRRTEATDQVAADAFRFTFEIARTSPLSSCDYLRDPEFRIDEDEELRRRRRDLRGRMPPAGGFWDPDTPRPVSPPSMGLHADDPLFGYGIIWSPNWSSRHHPPETSNVTKGADGAPTTGEDNAGKEKRRPYIRSISLQPFADGSLVKTEELLNGKPHEPHFNWSIQPMPEWSVSSRRPAFLFWAEEHWPPGRLPLGLLQVKAAVRLQVEHSDGNLELIELRARPEVVEIARPRQSYPPGEWSAGTVLAWLTFLGTGANWDQSRDVFHRAVQRATSPSMVAWTEDSGQFDLSIAIAAFQIGEHDKAYEFFKSAFEKKVGAIPSNTTPAAVLDWIHRCAEEAGRPDFSKDPKWLRTNFAPALPVCY